jgi:hypothetical protein
MASCTSINLIMVAKRDPRGATLEEVKRNVVKLQKLLMEAEEAHDKIKCLGIGLRAR